MCAIVQVRSSVNANADHGALQSVKSPASAVGRWQFSLGKRTAADSHNGIWALRQRSAGHSAAGFFQVWSSPLCFSGISRKLAPRGIVSSRPNQFQLALGAVALHLLPLACSARCSVFCGAQNAMVRGMDRWRPTRMNGMSI
jgi:hypothetical protein